MRDQFLIDPGVTFLNHGSFGACPIPVFETYQQWQRELECQPVEFLNRCYAALLDEAQQTLGDYLHTAAANLIFMPNTTVGINLVARSLDLQPGDEILTTDHEYGAMDKLWQFISQKTGAHYVRQTFPLPATSPDDWVELFWAGVTSRTRVIFLSHITSPTALILPVADVCKRARAAGILSVIDGAHAPGQIPLDLEAIGADFYAGNCHKWLCSPKGAGFLYARPDQHSEVEPLVVSWGWSAEGGSFAEQNQWQGTRDIAAYLSVPAAINFQQTDTWKTHQRRCCQLAHETRRRIADVTGIPPLTPEPTADSYHWFKQMFSARLPQCDPTEVAAQLYTSYRVEVPTILWNDAPVMRVSFQVYNTAQDANALLDALAQVLT